MASSEVASTDGVSPTIKAPRKRDFRQRAHCNPLADAFTNYPTSPDYVDWSQHFPQPIIEEEVSGAGEENRNCYDRYLATPFNTFDHPVGYPNVPVQNELNGLIYYNDMLNKNWPQVQAGPTILDIGCGYGGATIRLAETFPDKCVLGMEIREKLTDFVGLRIRAARMKVKPPIVLGDKRPEDYEGGGDHHYCNVSVIRQNAMKFLPHYIRMGQVEKIVFAFPDPNFKKCKWRRRIINPFLLSQYAYCMGDLGRLYTITDCYELHEWMIDSLNNHPLFNPLFISDKPKGAIPRHAYDEKKDEVLDAMDESDKQTIEFTEPWKQDFGEKLKDDPTPSLLTWSTEEGQKVLRNNMRSFLSVFERVKR